MWIFRNWLYGPFVFASIVGAMGCDGPKIHTGQSLERDRSRPIPVKMVGARNVRYCEILVVSGSLTDLTATVYNTLGCNDCPDSAWVKADKEAIRKEFGARTVVMNGPRYFMMDSIGQFNAAPSRMNIGGIDMIERAKLNIPFGERQGKKNPYTENIIRRQTEYVFNKGSEVYELVSPMHTYILQSYCQIVDGALTEKDLPGLVSRLKLPKGWQYKTIKLDNTLVLRTDSVEARVIQDDLDNTYQRVY